MCISVWFNCSDTWPHGLASNANLAPKVPEHYHLAIALTAAIASAVILSSYVFRSTQPNRQTIEAIDVKALVERIIKVESTGIQNAKNNFPAPRGLVSFLMTHGLKPSESIAAI
jgi:hypothetical protein